MDDEQHRWAGLCDEFPVLLDRAAAYWLDREFAELVARTRRAGASIWEWKELLDEIAERWEAEEDHSWRGDDTRLPAPPRRPVARKLETGFGCPAGLCDRQVAGSLLGAPPRCELLDREMTDIP